MNQKISWNKVWAAVSFLLLVLAVLMLGRTEVRAAAAPSGLHQTKASDTNITVEWDTVFNDDNRIRIWTRISDNESMSPCTSQRAYGTSEYYNMLSPGKTYYVQVGCSDDGSYSSAPPAGTAWSVPVKVVTAPSKVANDTIKCVKATDNSLAFTWQASAGATSYNVSYRIASAGSDTAAVTATDTNSITIGGLQADTDYDIEVIPVRTESGTGFAASYNSTSIWYIPTLPVNVSGIELNTFRETGYIGIEWNRYNVTDGFEVEIYKYNGKKPLVKGTATSNSFYTTNKKLKPSQIYKYRVRAYVNNADNQKSYTKWSSFQYCSRILDRATVKKSGTKMKVTWKKVTGAGSYIVSMATGSYGSTYKKMGTTKNIKNYTIKKNLKKGTDYYIKIVPVYQKGKKSVPGFSAKNDYTVHVWYSTSGKLYYYN